MKYLYFFLCLFLCCYYSFATDIANPNSMKIIMVVDSVRSEDNQLVANLTLINNSNIDYTYGDIYFLMYYANGQWLNASSESIFFLIEHVLPAGTTKKYRQYMSNNGLKFPHGIYKFIKSFSSDKSKKEEKIECLFEY